MSDIVGKVLSIILAFILLCIAPLSMVTLMEELADRRSIMNEVANFVDEIIDSKSLTQDNLADFYIAIASYGPVVDAKVVRYVREINPDPLSAGTTYTSYVVADNMFQWNQGDLVKVTVNQIGVTGPQRFIMGTIGLVLSEFDYTQAGRIR
ncbi:MAG: hypothetical protein LBS29_04225 [Endomicrobium sp.]|nr:hypothetical protein [Endomicrobium sp.]